jgi:hypothetical protein
VNQESRFLVVRKRVQGVRSTWHFTCAMMYGVCYEDVCLGNLLRQYLYTEIQPRAGSPALQGGIYDRWNLVPTSTDSDMMKHYSIVQYSTE